MTLTCLSEHVAPSSWMSESMVVGRLLGCACAACAVCQTIGPHSAPCVLACCVKPSMECASARMSIVGSIECAAQGLDSHLAFFPS